jgi:amylosucrase
MAKDYASLPHTQVRRQERAVTDEDAAAVGLDGHAHRSFLSDYYAGTFPGSHARGAVFQHNPETGDRRISGSFASLAGLERALEEQDETLVALAIERILLGHALICGFGGIPLVYMGDEIGLRNDYGFRADPEHAADNRWLHRLEMDWEAAARRRQAGSVEARIFGGLERIVEARQRTPHLHAAYPSTVLDMGNPHVFGHARSHPLGDLVAIYNFTESQQEISLDVLHSSGIARPYDQLGQAFVELVDGALRLTPYQRYWLI